MSKSELIDAYGRVWAAFNQTESHHRRFHAELWPETKPESAVVPALLRMVERSPAADADREAVVRHVGENWQEARVLATLASSCHCRDEQPVA